MLTPSQTDDEAVQLSDGDFFRIADDQGLDDVERGRVQLKVICTLLAGLCLVDRWLASTSDGEGMPSSGKLL